MNHDGLGMFQNQFCVEGNLKYKYNNGFIALSDPIATARNERKIQLELAKDKEPDSRTNNMVFLQNYYLLLLIIA